MMAQEVKGPLINPIGGQILHLKLLKRNSKNGFKIGANRDNKLRKKPNAKK